MALRLTQEEDVESAQRGKTDHPAAVTAGAFNLICFFFDKDKSRVRGVSAERTGTYPEPIGKYSFEIDSGRKCQKRAARKT